MRTLRASAIALMALVLAPAGMAQDATTPVDPWATSIGAGLAVTSGNSDTQSLNVSFNTLWDPKSDRTFKAEALYLRGESDGEKTVDKATADARYDLSLSERTFTFAEVAALRDPFRGTDYFISPLVGAGIFVIKETDQTLKFDGAVGAVMEKNSLLGTDTSGAVKAGENWDWKLSPTSALNQQLSGIWKTNNFSDALYHFAAGISSTLTPRSELKVSYVYDYRNEVASPDIKKGDSALFAALLFKF